MAEIRLSRRAVKDLDSLPKKVAVTVLNGLRRLGDDPRAEALDVKPLVGRRPWRRLRVGNYRVVFRPAERGRVLLVARIIDRKELERAFGNLPD